MKHTFKHLSCCNDRFTNKISLTNHVLLGQKELTREKIKSERHQEIAEKYIKHSLYGVSFLTLAGATSIPSFDGF